jgi:hypothetical protein
MEERGFEALSTWAWHSLYTTQACLPTLPQRPRVPHAHRPSRDTGDGEAAGRDCHAPPSTMGRMAPSLPNSSTRRDQRHRAGTSCSRPIVVGVPLLHPGSAQLFPLSNLRTFLLESVPS